MFAFLSRRKGNHPGTGKHWEVKPQFKWIGNISVCNRGRPRLGAGRVILRTGRVAKSRETMAKRIIVFGHNADEGLSRFVDKDGIPLDILTPRELPLQEQIKIVGCGRSHSVWVTERNEIYVAGDNRHGQLGRIPSEAELTTFPDLAPSARTMNSDDVGDDDESKHHQDDDNDVDDDDDDDDKNHKTTKAGKVSHPKSDYSTSATAPTILQHPLIDGKPIAYVACGDHHSVLASGTSVYTMGNNAYGQLGAITKDTVCEISFRVPIVQIACGLQHTLVRLDDGSVMAWGDNGKGQLGVGDFEPRRAPTQISLPSRAGLSRAAQVCCGHNFSAILLDTKNTPLENLEDGKPTEGALWPNLYTFGDNSCGQLGRKSYNPTLPTPVEDFGTDFPLTIHSIWCGGHHVFVQVLCAIVKEDPKGRKDPKTSLKKRVFVFGSNKYGELGLGPDVKDKFVQTPQQLVDLDSLEVRVSLGDCSSFVWVLPSKPKEGSSRSSILSTSSLGLGFYACGKNSKGELGLPISSSKVSTLTRVNNIDISDAGCTYSSRFTIILSGTDDIEPKVGYRKDIFSWESANIHQQSKDPKVRERKPSSERHDRRTSSSPQRRHYSVQAEEASTASEDSFQSLSPMRPPRRSESPQKKRTEESPSKSRRNSAGKKSTSHKKYTLAPEPESRRETMPPDLQQSYNGEQKRAKSPSQNRRASSPTKSHPNQKDQASPEKNRKNKQRAVPANQDLLQQQATLAIEMERLLSDQLMCDALVRAGRPSTFLDSILPTDTFMNTTPIMASQSPRAMRDEDALYYPVHGAILECRCTRLAQLIKQEIVHTNGRQYGTQDFARNGINFRAGSGWDWSSRMTRVNLAYASEAAMPTFLQFLYSDRDGLINQLTADHLGILLDLAYAAHSYGMDRLLGLCQLRIKALLDISNAVPVLTQACNLGLLAVKRCCLEFIRARYEVTISKRNRMAVETLNNNPSLLAEVVGLTSPEFADSLIHALPEVGRTTPSTLVHDLARLKDMASFADVEFQPSEAVMYMRRDSKRGGHNNMHTNVAAQTPICCHAIILAARCPALFDAVREHIFGSNSTNSGFGITRRLSNHGSQLKLIDNLKTGNATEESKERYPETKSSTENEGADKTQTGQKDALLKEQDVIPGDTKPKPCVAKEHRTVDDSMMEFIQSIGSTKNGLPRARVDGLSSETNRMQIGEVTEASPKAIRVFLDYLYSASTKNVTTEIAIDILMMCYVYKLSGSALDTAAAQVLEHSLDGSTAIDVICAATIVHKPSLQIASLAYAVSHARACLVQSKEKLRDAIQDFPDIGLALIQALSERCEPLTEY